MYLYVYLSRVQWGPGTSRDLQDGISRALPLRQRRVPTYAMHLRGVPCCRKPQPIPPLMRYDRCFKRVLNISKEPHKRDVYILAQHATL